MCGIFGIVFDKDRKDLGKILVEAGRRLSYRGYDSVGCAGISEDRKHLLKKDTGTVDEVNKKYALDKMTGKRGITQLRWATFGMPKQENAQPHYDCDENMIGAHNGNIVNTLALQKLYKKEGHKIRSENDGEMVVHAIEKHFDQTGDMVLGIINGAKELTGDYACVITHLDSEKMYCVKSGSSLYMGVGPDFICTSSDLPSILFLTDNIIILNDGEFVEFDDKNFTIRSLSDGKIISRKPEKCKMSAEAANKGGYDYFMEKEIREQPEKARNIIHFLTDSKLTKEFLSLLRTDKNIYFVGSGTSYHACLLGSYYFGELAHKQITACIAGSFIENYGKCVNEDDVVVLVSQSGETKDVMNILNYLQKEGKGKILSIVNVIGSTIMMRSLKNLPLCSDLEISVPATKTFLNQIIIFLYLALKYNEHYLDDYKEYFKEFENLPELIQKTIDITEKPCKQLADKKYNYKDMYCLGFGLMHPVALEGALKIKEIVYNHCEGMYSSEFKHGPLSIVDKNYPIIFSTCSDYKHMVVSHINEVACRGAAVIVISDEDDDYVKNSQDFIAVPKTNKYFLPVLETIPLQLFSYYLALKTGNDPDFPKNLSKTITVD
ncbi:MAG: glutamine--fructose-6-phosphate transaminase (isomerizing) [Armatimonadota bacterium]